MSKKHRTPIATTNNNAPVLLSEMTVGLPTPHAQAVEALEIARAEAETETEPESTHAFIQFVHVVAVEDTRGMEELTDRARIGLALGPHGPKVTAIVLCDGWFRISTEGKYYDVPVSNVRSARP